MNKPVQHWAIASHFCTVAEQYRTRGMDKDWPEYIRYGKAIGGLYKANKITPATDRHEMLANGEAYITAATEHALDAGIPFEQLRAAFSLAFGKAP